MTSLTNKIEIITAENCGFCFGVRKAVNMLFKEIELSRINNTRIYLFGKIIHNNSFIEELTAKGLIIIDDALIDDFKGYEFGENSTVVIRAHGIPKKVLEYLRDIQKEKNIKIVDATCECVKRMHGIAGENTDCETLTLIFGNKNHPEIKALESYVNGGKEIYKDFDELKSSFAGIKNYKKLIILVQTTHNIKDYIKCKNYILEISGAEILFFDTICSATEKRQAEAELLSKTSDIMIVVGGRNSSNTVKLYEICRKNCANSFIVETSEQLPLNIFKNLIKKNP